MTRSQQPGPDPSRQFRMREPRQPLRPPPPAFNAEASWVEEMRADVARQRAARGLPHWPAPKEPQ